MANFLRTGTIFNNPNLTKLSRDFIINVNTQMVYDFGRPYCWPTQETSLPTGSHVLNLVDNGSPMIAEVSAGSTMTFLQAEKSVKLSPSIIESAPVCRFNLPSTARFAANVNSALVVCWFTHTNTIDASRPTPAVFGYCYQNTVTHQYSIEYSRTGQKYRLRMNGVLIGDVAFPNAGEVLQIAVEYQNDGTVHGYHNGVLFASAPCGTTLNQPTPSSFPAIGFAGGYSPGWDGEVKRFWINKDDTHELNAARVLRDYNLNASRF